MLIDPTIKFNAEIRDDAFELAFEHCESILMSEAFGVIDEWERILASC